MTPKEVNIEMLRDWVNPLRDNLQSEDDEVRAETIRMLSEEKYIRAGIINRSKVAKQLGFSRSCFGSNVDLLTVLVEFEDFLRSEKYLPELTEEGHQQAAGKAPVKRDALSMKAARSEKRATALEVENSQLRARLHELESGMENLKELAEVLSELGVVKN